MISYKTTFEATENLPMIIAIGHGENADLVASFKDGGIDVALEGYTARAIYQPKSKWGTDDWYECPCEIVNDTVIAHWGNTYDNGDNAVKLFLHLVKGGKLAYPAIYQIRLFETPGFSPSAIEPIPETIDFSQYTLLNAPWALQSDFDVLSGNVNILSGNVNTLSGTVSTLSNEVESLPYLKGTAPHTSEVTITLSASTRHVYRVEPYGDNHFILVTFPTPTTQIFDCIIDVDMGDAEFDVGITFDDTNFASSVDGDRIISIGEKARYYITETRFMSDEKPILLIQRKDMEV